MKHIKYIALYLIFSIGFALLIYGSNITYQWDKFNWTPFLKELGFVFFITGCSVFGTWWWNKKEEKVDR
ncbi:hypothetical protein [Nonlabens antarcticus]|uniref:hypothetical protein n=1 Tax=Nonlabens antarcticus TaxID=392714 RepID=UPI0018914985|nr:hypothetical protein [Nonlabens antarcticus]